MEVDFLKAKNRKYAPPWSAPAEVWRIILAPERLATPKKTPLVLDKLSENRERGKDGALKKRHAKNCGHLLCPSNKFTSYFYMCGRQGAHHSKLPPREPSPQKSEMGS